MADNIPPQPAGSVRITLELDAPEKRLDSVLLKAMRENEKFKDISRASFKKLFEGGKISIKGQNARPSSALAKGTTYVDILA